LIKRVTEMNAKPETVFKYEPASMQSIQNLKHQAIYFASPTLFNDPFDCTITAAIEEPTDDEIETLRQHYVRKERVPHAIRDALREQSSDGLRSQFLNSFKQVIGTSIAEFLKHNGVSCFAERKENLLMWSHYAARYHGFCLEFRTRSEPFTKLRPVKYVDSIPQINLTNFILNDQYDVISGLYCTKWKGWEYEQEWRVIHKTAGTLFTYQADALKAIYFGPKMDGATKEILCLIIKGQNPNVELWNVCFVTDQFELVFEKFDYTSFEEGRRCINGTRGPDGACFCRSGKKVRHCCGIPKQ
jgi:hypothetical protein